MFLQVNRRVAKGRSDVNINLILNDILPGAWLTPTGNEGDHQVIRRYFSLVRDYWRSLLGGVSAEWDSDCGFYGTPEDVDWLLRRQAVSRWGEGNGNAAL